MNEEELKKEVVKYKSIREKILRLNEIIKCMRIIYGREYIDLSYNNGFAIYIVKGYAGCIFCEGGAVYRRYQMLKVKNCNKIDYFSCNNCKDKTLCTYCLCEKENCIMITKQKITFWLCTKNIFPKDIRRFITKLLFKN